jgi:hypothetical protein
MAIALTVRVSTRRLFTVPSLLPRAAAARVHLSRPLGNRHSFSYSDSAGGMPLAPLKGAKDISSRGQGANDMSTILLVILILLLVGALPMWPYSSGWGYFPSGGLGLVLLILIILAVSGRL